MALAVPVSLALHRSLARNCQCQWHSRLASELEFFLCTLVVPLTLAVTGVTLESTASGTKGPYHWQHCTASGPLIHCQWTTYTQPVAVPVSAGIPVQCQGSKCYSGESMLVCLHGFSPDCQCSLSGSKRSSSLK